MFLMHLLLFTLTYMRGTYARPSTHTLHFHKVQGERKFSFTLCVHMNFLIDFDFDIDFDIFR